MRTPKSLVITSSDMERLWALVKIGAPDECWPWQGALNNQGYGVLHLGAGNRTALAHRIVYFDANPSASPVLDVLHSCDCPACCNELHLFSGTHQVNMRDMVSKYRHAFGVRNGHAKLDHEKVEFIRTSGLSLSVLGRMFDVSPGTVGKARRAETWRTAP